MLSYQLAVLNAYGMDVDATVARFGGNESLMMRFLTGFPNDKNMQTLRVAMELGDREALKTAAHTLKGLTGNLGLTPLFEASTELMNTLRQTEDDISELYNKVNAEYERTLTMLSTLAETK